MVTSYKPRSCSVAVLLIFIVALGFLGFFSIPNKVMAAPGWLGGWEYRKNHTISQAAGAGTMYQIKVMVYYGSGSDAGQTVYCDGKCKADFGDVRYAGSDGITLLDYWIEEQVDGDHAAFWVEVAEDLGSSDVTIYMYYGNAAATTTSNGDTTFVFFDHFGGDSLDLSKWVVRQGDVSVAGGELILTANAVPAQRGLIDGLTSYGANNAVNTKTRLSPATTTTQHFCSMRQSGSWDNRAGDLWTTGTNQADYETVESNISTYSVVSLNDVTIYHLYRAAWRSGESRFYQDNTLKSTITTNVPSVDMVAVFYEGQGSSTYCYIDWIFVCRWVDPEPAQGAWGSQEQGHRPALSMTPTAVICRKLSEAFIVRIDLSEPYYAEDFEFKVLFNTTLLDCMDITWDAWHTGAFSVDEVTGTVSGSTSGNPVTGNLTIVSMTFVAACNHIWRNEETMTWQNVQAGGILIERANLSYQGSPDLQYERGIESQIDVGPDVTYSWSPIKGDLNLDGHVDIFDLSAMAQYVNVKEGDPLWLAASKYDITNSAGKAINVLDLITVVSNYWYEYDP